MASSLDSQMTSDVADQDGLTRTCGLGDVDPGRFATRARTTTDVRRDEVLHSTMNGEVVLPETLQGHVGRVRAVVVGAVLSQKVRPRHTEARPCDVALGRERQGHQRVVDIVGVIEVRDSGAAKGAFSDDQVRTSVVGGRLNRIEYGGETTHLYNRENRTLDATLNRSDR